MTDVACARGLAFHEVAVRVEAQSLVYSACRGVGLRHVEDDGRHATFDRLGNDGARDTGAEPAAAAVASRIDVANRADPKACEYRCVPAMETSAPFSQTPR